MSIEFREPVFVHELWADLPDATLIAQCQHPMDAEALVTARLERDGPESKRRYVITNTYDGKQFVRAFKAKEPS